MSRSSLMVFVAGLVAVFVLSLSIADDNALTVLRETEYSKRIAEDFRGSGFEAYTEVVQPDGSRVDILIDGYAIEVEWAHKWEEAIGQSVLYGLETNCKPCVILLLKGDSGEDENYLRCLAVCSHLGIHLDVRHIKNL